MSNLVYFSSGATGYTHAFIERLGLPAERIPFNLKESQEFRVYEPYVLVVPTYKLAGTHGNKDTSLPRQVASFLNIPENRDLLRGVVGAGNRNFYTDFGVAADTISTKTGVPIIHRIELSGSDEDVKETKERLNKFWQLVQKSQQKTTRTSMQS